MAKNKPIKNTGKNQGKKAPPVAQKKTVKAKPKRNYTLLLLIAVVGVTFIAYFTAIHNELTNWDDNAYIYFNPLVKSLSFSNIKDIFTQYMGGNYHPLAILSLAIDYHFYGIPGTTAPGYESYQGTWYHAVSIIIHLCSVIALFYFCLRLTKEVWVAVLTSLLFGIHPMHVESVAWAAERKDQLYVLFYFIALVIYVGYLQNEKGKTKYYLFTILFYLLSLLSKGQAVTLPVVLLGLDYYVKRKWSWNIIIEKIPFFILSVAFGIIAVLAQKTSHSIQDIKIFPYVDRVMFACYGLVNYLSKMVLPIHLSAFYPYPEKPHGAYPVMVYISPVIVMVLLGLLIWAIRKSRLVVFGSLFFLANIILLLQLLPVGSAIMSDRYTYLAYTGLFFIIAVLINNFFKSTTRTAKNLKPFFAIGFCAYLIFLAITTYNRNEVWQNSDTLWTDVMKKEPRCYMAYNQIGSVHQGQATLDDEKGLAQDGREKLAAALMDFKNAIGLNPEYPEAYVNRSDVYRVEGKLNLAIRDCDSALKYRPNYPEAYINRGIALASSGMARGDKHQIDSAMGDFKHAVRLDHNLPNIYANMGNIYDMRGKLDSAIICYTKAIVLDPTKITPYESRGRSLREKGSLDSALNDLKTSIKMCQDRQQNAMESYYQRSLVYNQKGNKKQALQDAITARSLGRAIDSSYINSLKAQQ